jgi:anti-sigma-K factor RskA
MSGLDAMRELTCDDVREMAGAYVLGALDTAEAAAVRAHLATCPEAHDEVAELGAVIPALLEAVPIAEPPAGLKSRILAAAAADLAARTTTGTSTGTSTIAPPIAPVAAPVAFPSAAERSARAGRPSTGTWLLRIAAVLAIVVLGGWNALLQDELSSAQRYEDRVAIVLDLAARPGSRTAILAGDGGTGTGLAAVDANGNMAIAMRDLVPTSGNEVYEAWMIGGDSVPIPLGSFRVGSTGTAYFEGSGVPAADGIVLALTREAGPGALTPTLPVISKGATTSSG